MKIIPQKRWENRLEVFNMIDLYSSGEKVNSIFHFYGKKENSITNAFVWVLANCPIFTQKLITGIFNSSVCAADDYTVSIQSYEQGKGITDVEITDNENFFVIVEAKRGLSLPGVDQLDLYSRREKFYNSSATHRAIVSMSEHTREFANLHLPPTVNGFDVYHISWKMLYEISKDSITHSTHKQKWVLNEFSVFLGGLSTMQDQNSNWVYVVSLGRKPKGWEISYYDIVEKYSVYFHPIKKRWPSKPPNYIAFRYYGKLQSIHHIESYKVFTNPSLEIAELPNEDWGPFYLYKLGKAIKPLNEVKTGDGIHRARRVEVMLDTLLTSNTITEALDISNERKKKQKETDPFM